MVSVDKDREDALEDFFDQHAHVLDSHGDLDHLPIGALQIQSLFHLMSGTKQI